MEKGQRKVSKWTLGGAARPHLSLEYRYIWATYSSTGTLPIYPLLPTPSPVPCCGQRSSTPRQLSPSPTYTFQKFCPTNRAPSITRALPPLSRPWCLPFLSPAVAPPSRTPAHLGVWLRGIGSVVGRGAASDRGWCWLRLPSLEVEQTTVSA